MNAKLESLCDDIENSSESAAVSFVDHLRTVASNGRSYGTLDAMRAEAEAIKGWAEYFLERAK